MRSVPGRWGGALLGAAAGVFVGMALWLGFGMPQAPPLALFSMICGGVGAFFVSGSIYVQAQVAKERELAALADGMEGLVGAGAPPDGEGPHAAATV